MVPVPGETPERVQNVNPRNFYVEGVLDGVFAAFPRPVRIGSVDPGASWRDCDPSRCTEPEI